MPLTTENQLAITTLISKLAQALDFSHPADFVDVFTSDGVYQAVSSTVSGEVLRFRHEGSEALLRFAESAVQRRQGLGRHWTGNLVIDGDQGTATAISYVLFIEIDPTTKERRIPISGVHRDTFVKTPKHGWRFTSRTIVADI
jgi:hypothetical protein